jgi:hypothetical protein
MIEGWRGVAKIIATIGGIALAPGVSKNRRLYTAEHVADAVARAQKRIESGDRPMVMLTHHGAGDDSRQIAASLTSVSLDEAGRARYRAAIADTDAGRDIAALVDTSDGKPPHLDGVSIRGYWLGTVRKVKGPDGQPVETADGLDWEGLDFTRSPGVDAASVDTFAWASRSGRTETTERVPITESVQEARVTITEEAAPGAAPALTEADRDALPFAAAHVLENGICATCAAVAEGGDAPGNGKLPYGDIQYADPGYQADKQKRYPVDTKAHVRAALAYLAKKANAAKYTPAQLKRVMGRIRAAAKKFGITVAAESAGWSFGSPARVSEALAEHLGIPSCAGSWSVRASNGPVDICLSSYSMDPEDLDVILRAAADAACKALSALDPDMDGDVDLPGVGGDTDPDHDAPGESAPDEEPPTDPAASPAAATTETEDPAMAETTTPAAESAPGIDPSALAEAVTRALEAQETARRTRKAEKKRAARESAAAEAAKQAQANAALAQGTPATEGATATETDEQRIARLSALADRKFAEAAAREGLAVTETDEQILERLLEEKLVPLRQARAEGGGVQRKGLAALESIADGPDTARKLQSASNEELAALAGAAFGPGGRR